MSIDAPFSRMTFPTVRGSAGDAASAARGHSAGYLAGLRAARTEADTREAVRVAEHAAAMREQQAHLDLALAALGAAAQDLRTRTAPVLADANVMLATAAVDIAEAILTRELDDGERSARSAITRAFDGIDPVLVQAVQLHPADLASLPAVDIDALRAAGVELVADPMLARGDALSLLADGQLDARISTALARVRSELLGES
ncbi:FliH/SctL family protein [Marisediminicola antarctica]|nr:FliH/SctL family protein [Marisediminicola antarctica]